MTSDCIDTINDTTDVTSKNDQSVSSYKTADSLVPSSSSSSSLKCRYCGKKSSHEEGEERDQQITSKLHTSNQKPMKTISDNISTSDDVSKETTTQKTNTDIPPVSMQSISKYICDKCRYELSTSRIFPIHVFSPVPNSITFPIEEVYTKCLLQHFQNNNSIDNSLSSAVISASNGISTIPDTNQFDNNKHIAIASNHDCSNVNALGENKTETATTTATTDDNKTTISQSSPTEQPPPIFTIAENFKKQFVTEETIAIHWWQATWVQK